jgi:hypothetical protein
MDDMPRTTPCFNLRDFHFNCKPERSKEEFFFEKKNQKTFAIIRSHADAGVTLIAKIFCFFIQKEALSSSTSASRNPTFWQSRR